MGNKAIELKRTGSPEHNRWTIVVDGTEIGPTLSEDDGKVVLAWYQAASSALDRKH